MQSIAFSWAPTGAARSVWFGQAEVGAIGSARCAPAAGATTSIMARPAAKTIPLRITAPFSSVLSHTRKEERVPWTQRRKENAIHGDESPEIRAGVARAAQPRAVPGDPQGGHRARLHRPLRQRE